MIWRIMGNIYDERYDQDSYYWGLKPSSMCSRILEIAPSSRGITLLDIGCGEGRDAVFFARKGYKVTGFDTSPVGIEKAERLAEESQVTVEFFTADINEFRLDRTFDVIFSTGVLQYIPPELREEVFENYRKFTAPSGINAHSVFVHKPFIQKAPDAETKAHRWHSGELLALFKDWKIEYTAEDIFDCNSSGVSHRHAMSRVIAGKVDRSSVFCEIEK
jgi:tellurite methyltransferase